MQSDSSAIRERPSNLDCWLPVHQQITAPFVVHADEKLTAFVELEAATRACGELS
jgi:hypothetical protein